MTSATRTVPFGRLSIEYDEHVLAPREWTVRQAQWAAELLAEQPAGPLLELCTGAGQIGLAAAVLANRDAVLVDRSEAACRFACRNAASAGIAGRIDIRHAPMTDALAPEERFALVLADPPYIPSHGTEVYPRDPLSAIDGGQDGLVLARMCLAVGARHLTAGRPLLLQLRDEAQAGQVVGELDLSTFEHVETRTFPGGGAVVHLVRSSAP